MQIDVLTLFPGMFAPVLGESVIGRAARNGILDLRITDIRDFSLDKHKKVDDYPYGGGHGMIMAVQPLYDAWKRVSEGPAARTVYMSPQGVRLTQKKALELSRERRLIIVCGHYEGVDERAIELIADEEISIGDYVLTGGEIPAMALIDCVSRLIPGVISDGAACSGESHTDGLLEYPQYTRPARFMDMDVPPVLLGGNHADIERWRTGASLERTRKKRPDMLAASLRRIPAGLAYNIRDLGGYPACGGYATRWRTFLRSDLLEGFTDRDIAAMSGFGLATVIDLRSREEAELLPDPFEHAGGVDYHIIPLISDSAIEKSILTAPFKELYILFAERGRKKIGRIFTIMAGSRGACLFHCYAGKDRTGIIAALLLLAVGVDRNDVVADYEVSGTYYRRRIGAYNGDSFNKSEAENIEHLLAHIDKKYGDATGYLRAAGVSEQDLGLLRDKFLANPIGPEAQL